MTAEPILQFRSISKSFPGVQALEDVSLDVMRGEILAIMGENGAGKSTLMKIAAGLYHPDKGDILLNGQPAIIRDAQKALALGIGMVPQELNLVTEMNVAENLLLGIEPRRGVLVNKSQLHRSASQLLASLNIGIDTYQKVKYLTVAQQQMVQIARALANKCHILIMDEPTASLSHRETESLLEYIRFLRERGTTILYISHRIKEVLEIADRIAVLRDGKLITVLKREEADEDILTRSMIGRSLQEAFQPNQEHTRSPDIVLEGRGLTSQGLFEDVSFALHRGEILGFAGLVGAGRSEVFGSIFGFHQLERGEIFVEGKRVTIKSPLDAIRLGIGYVPEERKRQGLFLLMNVMHNISMPFLRRFRRMGVIKTRDEQNETARLSQQLNVKTPSLGQRVEYLSGGNQQKVILARWIGSGARILILDEPTRGIDVNAKSEIHHLIAELAASGNSIVVISSELQELLMIADRIIVMREGRVVGEVEHSEATEEKILRLAMWGADQPQVSEAQPTHM